MSESLGLYCNFITITTVFFVLSVGEKIVILPMNTI